jgi:Tol biopolymer transport system component
MKLQRREMAIGLIGLLIGGGLLLFWLSPRIIAFEPVGTAVSAAHPIQLKISRNLDLATAEQFLQIEPPVDGRFQMKDGLLQFVPQTIWPYDQRVAVTIRGGWPAQNGLPMWRGQQWSFEAGQPDIFFVTSDEVESLIWTALPGRGEATVWLREPGEIVDAAMAADGRSLLLTVLDDQDRSHLIRHHRFPPARELLLTCSQSLCRQPWPQPDGRLVAYERLGSAGSRQQPEVWLLDSQSGESWPAHDPALFREPSVAAALATRLSHSPRWSPDGRTLAYFKPDAHLIILLHVSTLSPPALIPAQLNEMGGWSPQGDALIYTELTFGDPAFFEQWEEALLAGKETQHLEPGLYNHVVHTEVTSGRTTDLSEGLPAEESSPGWSPDGRYLAFSRSIGGAGRQIWQALADGQSASPLTTDPFYHHSAPRWSPDGRYLLFMRSSLTPGSEPPAIWLVEIATGQTTQISAQGFLPGWRP